MERGDVDHLDRLARRVDAPGPIAAVDPLARNLLGAAQAAGRGSPKKWSWTNSDFVLYGGSLSEYIPNTVSVENVPTANGPDLFWDHPTWPGYPVAPGMTVTWWTPGLVAGGAALGQLRIQWFDASGALLSTGTTNAPAVPMVRPVPAGAAYARPAARFTAKGLWEMGSSAFTLGDTSAALLAGERPAGEGCPAVSVTGYSHAPADGNGAFRDIGLDLVEVTSSATG
ncbi:hypothetical protein [Streptomyces sp. NPDC055189]